MNMPSVLERIIATKREEIERRRAATPLAELEERIDGMPAARDFHGALAARIDRGEPAIIAEFKRASPSAGWIREHADPAEAATAYQSGGAACLSVLTDAEYFGGSDEDLDRARSACRLPVIRKDFIVDPYQVFETRAMGADALLLIVAALDDSRLRDLSALAFEIGLSVLVEVHDADEMDRALAFPGHLLGINNRDLHRFETRLETSERLARCIPDDRIGVAESGLRERADIERMQSAGLNAFLIGEALMRGGDPASALRSLRAA